MKVRDSQIDTLIKHGKKLSLVKYLKDHIDLTLSAAQLGVTLSSLGLGWVGEETVHTAIISSMKYIPRVMSEHLSHILSLTIAFLIISTLHILFGELLPKALAIRNPLGVATFISGPFYWFGRIFKPFIWFLQFLAQKCLALLGVESDGEEEAHSEEELRMIVAESEEDGLINAGERELIHNVFDFDNKDVSEIMTPAHKIFAVSANKWDQDVIENIFAEGYSRVPIYQQSINNIVGWVLVKDIITKIIQKKEVLLHELMRPIHYVPENQRIIDCLRELQRQHMHVAIVTSEYGTTIGLITMEDIIEELVGDIHDEGDETIDSLVQHSNGGFLIDCSGSLDEVNDLLPLPLPVSDEYDTVSGMINNLFGRLPSIGEEYQGPGYILKITKKKKQRIEQIELKIL